MKYYAVSSPHFEYTWQIPLQAVEESLPGLLSIVERSQAQVQIIGDKSVQLPNGMTLDNMASYTPSAAL